MPLETLNNHAMYYETHGEGDPVLVMTGWGTFCHGEERHLPWGLTDNYQAIIFDHRGIGDSGDDLSVEPSITLYADDAIALLDHLGLSNVHIIGLVGMGACISQEMALKRPDLVRSLINTGCWANVDSFFRGQMELFRTIHRDLGFLEFQKTVTLLSFEPGYFNKNIERFLGPKGVWGDLNGRFEAHSRFIDACLGHDVLDRLGGIEAPALIVHAALDQVTSPRLTKPIEEGIPNAEGVLLEDCAHVVAGKALKKRFSDIVMSFLAKH